MPEKGKLRAIGERPMTWQQAVAVLAVIPTFLFVILLFAEGEDAQRLRHSAWLGLPASAAAVIFFTLWHFRRIRRPDLFPDILAQMVPQEQILQVGRCHLYIAARPCGIGVEVGVFIQNLTDGLGILRLQFKPPFSVWGRSVIIPELECEVPPGAVIHAHGRFASDFDRSSVQKVYLEGNFYSTGKQVRFARRSVITRRMNPLLNLGLLLASHYHRRGGVYIEITPDAQVSGDETVDFDEQWTTSLIWSPENGAHIPSSGIVSYDQGPVIGRG
jgi:hypothetical protein